MSSQQPQRRQQCPKCGGDIEDIYEFDSGNAERSCTDCNWHIYASTSSEKSKEQRISELEQRVAELEILVEEATYHG